MTNIFSGGGNKSAAEAEKGLICGKPSVACHREMKEGVEEEYVLGEGSTPSRQWRCSFNVTYYCKQPMPTAQVKPRAAPYPPYVLSFC